MFSIISSHPRLLQLRAQSTPYWSSGSFLYLLSSEILLQVFDDLDLLPASQTLALESLLRFLDFYFPDSASFLVLRGGELRALARRWVMGGAGRRFWCENSRHVQHNEFLDMYGVTEYLADRQEILYNVKALLEMVKPRMKTFLDERARAAALRIGVDEEEEGEEDDNVVEESSLPHAATGAAAAPAPVSNKRKRDDEDSGDEGKPQKRQLTMTIRTKA